MTRVKVHKGSIGNLWGNAQHIVYEYSGRSILREIAGRPYRLVAFYESNWTYPLVVDEYISRKANPEDYVTKDLTGEFSGTFAEYTDAAIGNLPSSGYPATLLSLIGGIWHGYGTRKRLETVKHMVKASKGRSRLRQRQSTIMGRVR